MAITPDKTQIEQAGLEYIEPHEIVADTGPKALNLLAQAVVDGLGGVDEAEVRAIIEGMDLGGGSGVEEVSGTVTLDANGPRLRQFYTVGASTIGGETFAVDTALVARRTAAGVWQVAVVDDAEWRAFALDPVPDTTAPTAGTLASSAITATSFTLTVSGASDAVALHAAPYAFSTDDGTTWTAYQSSAVYVASGLTASTGYQARHKVRDAAGNESTGAAITVNTTAPPPLTGDIMDDFNAADGPINGRQTPTGGAVWTSPWDAGVNSKATLAIISNRLTHPAGDTGASARIAVASQDYTVACDFDITPSGSQVRLHGRSALNADEGANNGMAFIRNRGGIYEVLDQTGAVQGTVASPTGRLEFIVSGTTGTAKVDGVQIGAPYTVPTSNPYAGVSCHNGGAGDNWTLAYA